MNLRKALLYSVDRTELVTYVLSGQGTALNSVIADGIATNPSNGNSIQKETGNLIYTNLEEAKGYYETALKELGETKLTLELSTSDSDAAKKTGEYLKNAWEQALPGLTVDFKPVVTSVRFDAMMSVDFDLALGGWSR